jgi:hypothetical protein
MPAVLRPEVVDTYRALTGAEAFETLVDWGDTYLGAVTGRNRYFSLDREAVFRLRIPKEELLPISPPGSRHLRDLTFTDSAWEALLAGDRSCYLLMPNVVSPSREALEYIWAGEKTGVHKAYKCRVRTPWWRVPTVPVADLLLTYMDRDRPRLVTNRAGVRHLNSLYGVRLRPGRRKLGMDLLPLAAVNSLTLLGGELVGRAYGGGMLKLEPREADNLPLPSFTLLGRVAANLRPLRARVAQAIRDGDLLGAVALVDQVILSDALGLAPERIEELREAREVMFGRRASRANRSNGTG